MAYFIVFIIIFLIGLVIGHITGISRPYEYVYPKSQVVTQVPQVVTQVPQALTQVPQALTQEQIEIYKYIAYNYGVGKVVVKILSEDEIYIRDRAGKRYILIFSNGEVIEKEI